MKATIEDQAGKSVPEQPDEQLLPAECDTVYMYEPSEVPADSAECKPESANKTPKTKSSN